MPLSLLRFTDSDCDILSGGLRNWKSVIMPALAPKFFTTKYDCCSHIVICST